MLPREILQAEIMDWWEAERERVKSACADIADRLQTLVKADAQDLAASDFTAKTSKLRTELDNKITDRLNRFEQDLAEQLNADLLQSMVEFDGRDGFDGTTRDQLKDLAAGISRVGSAGLLGLIPLAIPAPTGALAFIGLGAIAPVAWLPVAGLGLGAVLLGAVTPLMRSGGVEKLRRSYVEHRQGVIVDRLWGKPKDGVSSLGYFFDHLDRVRDKRLEAIV